RGQEVLLRLDPRRSLRLSSNLKQRTKSGPQQHVQCLLSDLRTVPYFRAHFYVNNQV
ncbi:hypothetical protein Bpfe_029698, partial [Biomphalaria pfeifferi]